MPGYLAGQRAIAFSVIPNGTIVVMLTAISPVSAVAIIRIRVRLSHEHSRILVEFVPRVAGGVGHRSASIGQIKRRRTTSLV